MGLIRGYDDGADITLLNVIYHKPKKQNNGKYGKDSIDLIYKDNVTGEKKHQHIVSPNYTYYMTNEGIPVDYPRLFIEKESVHPVTCNYTELKKSIAENTNNLDFFFDNIRNGNYKENDRLFDLPNIYNADMNIEDYYWLQFSRTYKNDIGKISKLFFDIEVDTIDISGNFPELGECPVNAITLIDTQNSRICTLLLENYNNPLIDQFKQDPNVIADLKSFVQSRVGGWKNEKRLRLNEFSYHIMYYSEEINLIADFFSYINNTKPDFALAWNMAFDVPYLIARIANLGYNPIDIVCHKDFEEKVCYYYIDKRAEKFEERNDGASISSYTVYLDQLIAFASRRKGQRAIPSYKLDVVGGIIANIHKLDYSHITTKLAELPYKDYHTFVFYNVMDTIVQYVVESKVGDVEFVYNIASICCTRYPKVHRQTTYLINRCTKDFYEYGYVIGNNHNKNNEKEGFAGAFVADPVLVSNSPKIKLHGIPIMVCDNNVDFDYKALYPSIIGENNVAPNTQYGKIILPEPLDARENRYNNNTFDRTVWFVEDYVSHDILNFCKRYLHLAGYEEMYDDIIRYYTTIAKTNAYLRTYDTINGLRYIANICDNERKRSMVRILDGPRKMCIMRERMPK